MKYDVGVRSWVRMVQRLHRTEQYEGRWLGGEFLASLRVKQIIREGGTVHPQIYDKVQYLVVDWFEEAYLLDQKRESMYTPRLAEAGMHCAYIKQELVRLLRASSVENLRDRWESLKEFFGGHESPEIQELEAWVSRCEQRARRAQMVKGQRTNLESIARAFKVVAEQLVAEYPEHRVLVLGRDCEVLYHMVKDSVDCRYAEISRLVARSETSMEEVALFLACWSPEKSLVVVDTGFAGSIPKALLKLTPLEGRLMSSACEEFPTIGDSSRDLVTSIERLWKSENRATNVVAEGDDLRVVARESVTTDSGEVDPEMAKVANRRILRLAKVAKRMARMVPTPGQEYKLPTGENGAPKTAP